MKRTIFLLMMLPSICLAQKIESDKIDDFTGQRNISTTRIDFDGPTTTVGGTAYIKGKDTLIGFTLFFRTTRTTSTDKATLLLKLDNNEIITLQNVAKYEIISSGRPGFIITKTSTSDRESLKKHKVLKYRVNTSNTYIDVDLSPKHQTAFGDILKVLEAKLSQ